MLFEGEKTGEERFNSAAWIASEGQGITQSDQDDRTRPLMIDDLLATYDFTGYSRAQIVGLLGDPSFHAASPAQTQWDEWYLIEREHDDSTPGQFKFLVFDLEQDKVVKYQTTVD